MMIHHGNMDRIIHKLHGFTQIFLNPTTAPQKRWPIVVGNAKTICEAVIF
jgi:hypothetical protein